jgi:hypothetical protein
MKQLTFALALLAVTATSAAADELVATAPPAKLVGVDGAFVLPVGDYANVATVGVGALGRLELAAGPGFITARTGVIFHAGTQTNAAITLVPLYAGYRQPLGTSGAYLAGELGITEIFATVNTGFGRMSASDAKLGLTLGGGYKHGALDIRAGLFAPDVNNALGLMATVGYDFAQF